MSKIYIQLGKFGDILNILPLLKADFDNGNKAALMVAKEFAFVLELVSYVDPVIFHGETFQIEEAYKQAKDTGRTVVCTQVIGPKEQTLKYSYEPAGKKHAETDSFAREAWNLAGSVERWGLPLELDMAQPTEVAQNPKKRLILLSADSKSSPFPYYDLLTNLIEMRFNRKGYEVKRITKESVNEQLGLFNAAHCLVTVDTAQLHLAYATNVPVAALVQDKPNQWNGSTWRPNHFYHCRYSDFPMRAIELLDRIANLEVVKSSKLMVYNVLDFKDTIKPVEGWKQVSIQPGACGRHSGNTCNDENRIPMLRSVLRMAFQAAKEPDALICLTRPGTMFSFDALQVMDLGLPCWGYRRVISEGTVSHSPFGDAFCAKKKWWQDHFGEIADMIMGRDIFWSRMLIELFTRQGAVEMEGVCRET